MTSLTLPYVVTEPGRGGPPGGALPGAPVGWPARPLRPGGSRLPAPAGPQGPPLPRLLARAMAPRALDLAGHLGAYGPLPLPRRGAGLIDVIERAGLTGRGGAGFPTGRKMRSVASLAAAGSGGAVVVANGCEGELASFKDRLLLMRLPHLVLDGIALAAAAVGAKRAYLCVHRAERMVVETLAEAIAARRRARVDPVPVHLVGIPGRYVSSEQSALVHYINGGAAKPVFAQPRLHERGVDGRPTLVNNVETLANVALIARYGDRWFRCVGLPSAPGSTLLTVGGAVARPGVYEIALGTTIGQVMALASPVEPVAAILTGGYFGCWLPAEVAWPLPATHADLRAAGGALGAGIMIALPATSCGLAETARVVRYLAGETAGQCGPCVMGLPALADTLSDLAFQGGRPRRREQLARLHGLVNRRGACRHPDGAVQLAASAMTAFARDVSWHEQRGPCHGVNRLPLLPLPAADEAEGDWQ